MKDQVRKEKKKMLVYLYQCECESIHITLVTGRICVHAPLVYRVKKREEGKAPGRGGLSKVGLYVLSVRGGACCYGGNVSTPNMIFSVTYYLDLHSVVSFHY